jgi:hypothetical protein
LGPHKGIATSGPNLTHDIDGRSGK